MKKRLANRVAAILFALALVLTGVLSFDFGMGEVKATLGYSVQITGATIAASVEQGSSVTFNGTNGSFTITGSSISGNANSNSFNTGSASLTFSFTPSTGYTASLLYDGNPQTITNNSCTVNLTNLAPTPNIFDVSFSNGSGGGGGNTPDPSWGTRNVTISIDPASQFMLAKDGFEIGFSDGGNNDTYRHMITTGTSITGAYDPSVRKIYINCRVAQNYFVPSMVAQITYADGSTETASDGTADMGGSNLAVEIPIKDNRQKQGDVSIGLKLMVDKQVQANATSASVSGGTVRYNVTENGATNIADTANVSLTIADTADDAATVAQFGNAVIDTFDLGLAIDGTAQTDLNKPVEVAMQIDTSRYPNANYSMARNHNGTVTRIDSRYVAQTGTIIFQSAGFSAYSLLADDAPAAAATASAPAADPVFVAAANDPAKTGAVYIGKAELPPATSITALEGVTVTGINPITDQNAIAALTGEYSMLWNKSRGLGANERTFAFDLAASGSGKVAFYVGTGSPSAAVISHYHGGMWTRQIVDVVNGQAVGTFRDFSPMFITVYEGVTADQVRAAGITDTEGATATVGAKSPKTEGTSPVIWMILVIALAGAGVVALRKRA